MIGSVEVESDYLNIYYFLPSITDQSEEINKYLNNVSVSPIDITQDQLNTSTNSRDVDPAELDLFGVNKKITANSVIKSLNYMNDISNSNLTINADGVLSRREVDVPVD